MARLLVMQDTAESEIYFEFSVEEQLVCRKSDSGSSHSPSISISQCSGIICQSPDSEHHTQTTSSGSDTTPARPLTHTFPALCSGFTLSHHQSVFHIHSCLDVQPTNNFSLLNMRISCNGKKLTCKTLCLAQLLTWSLIMPYNSAIHSIHGPSVIIQMDFNTYTS